MPKDKFFSDQTAPRETAAKNGAAGNDPLRVRLFLRAQYPSNVRMTALSADGKKPA